MLDVDCNQLLLYILACVCVWWGGGGVVILLRFILSDVHSNQYAMYTVAQILNWVVYPVND